MYVQLNCKLKCKKNILGEGKVFWKKNYYNPIFSISLKFSFFQIFQQKLLIIEKTEIELNKVILNKNVNKFICRLSLIIEQGHK